MPRLRALPRLIAARPDLRGAVATASVLAAAAAILALAWLAPPSARDSTHGVPAWLHRMAGSI